MAKQLAAAKDVERAANPTHFQPQQQQHQQQQQQQHQRQYHQQSLAGVTTHHPSPLPLHGVSSSNGHYPQHHEPQLMMASAHQGYAAAQYPHLPIPGAGSAATHPDAEGGAAEAAAASAGKAAAAAAMREFGDQHTLKRGADGELERATPPKIVRRQSRCILARYDESFHATSLQL